jgi:hypothetical protein
MSRRPPQRRRRPGRRPPGRYSGGHKRSPPSGFTGPGFRQLHQLILQGLKGPAKKRYFNELSSGIIVVAGICGAVFGLVWFGWLGASWDWEERLRRPVRSFCRGGSTAIDWRHRFDPSLRTGGPEWPPVLDSFSHRPGLEFVAESRPHRTAWWNPDPIGDGASQTPKSIVAMGRPSAEGSWSSDPGRLSQPSREVVSSPNRRWHSNWFDARQGFCRSSQVILGEPSIRSTRPEPVWRNSRMRRCCWTEVPPVWRTEAS